MEFLAGLVPFVIWIIIISSIIKATKKKSPKSKSTKNRKPPVLNAKVQGKQPGVAKSVSSTKFSSNAVLVEDRKNDWLAQQIREEARISRRNATDLGFGHQDNCDAKALKKEHKKEHGKF